MTNIEEKIEHLLKTAWPEAEIKTDFSDQKHFYLEIGCKEFAEKKTVEQHRMVYNILGELLKSGELHALGLKTKIL